MRKILLIMLAALLAMPLLTASELVEVDANVDSVTLYSSTAFVTKSAAVSTGLGEKTLRLTIPSSADNETFLIIDDGATVRQVSFSSAVPEEKSIILRMLEANLGESIVLMTKLFNISGTIGEIVREQYIVVKEAAVSQAASASQISIPVGQSIFVPINIIESMTLAKQAEIPSEEKLEQQYADVLETVTKSSRRIATKYFVSGASWEPVYHYFLDSESKGRMYYWSKLNNSTGEDWEDVSLAIVAGQPNMKPELEGYYYRGYTLAEDYESKEMAIAPAAVEGRQYSSAEALEYHIYDLQGRLSVKKDSSVLVPILTETLNHKEEYIWTAGSGNVLYNIRIVNSTKEPFAAGWVSVFKDAIYMGGDSMKWTAVDANSLLYIAPALDIKAEKSSEVNTDEAANVTTDYYKVKLTLENHKSKAVTIKVRDSIRSDAEGFSSTIAPDKIEENTLEWNIKVEAGAKKEIIYTYYTKYYSRY